LPVLFAGRGSAGFGVVAQVGGAAASTFGLRRGRTHEQRPAEILLILAYRRSG
jgi:hypothetical protein